MNEQELTAQELEDFNQELENRFELQLDLFFGQAS